MRHSNNKQSARTSFESFGERARATTTTACASYRLCTKRNRSLRQSGTGSAQFSQLRMRTVRSAGRSASACNLLVRTLFNSMADGLFSIQIFETVSPSTITLHLFCSLSLSDSRRHRESRHRHQNSTHSRPSHSFNPNLPARRKRVSSRSRRCR